MVGRDPRWTGAHGIGRYSAEVAARLTTPNYEIALRGRPSSPMSSMHRPKLQEGTSAIYSPGYSPVKTSVPQVLTLHDLIHLESGDGGRRAIYRMFYDRVIRPVVRRTGVVLTVSETSARRLSTWIADDSVEIVVTGNGVSDAFTPSEEPETRGRPYVLFVGNMKSHKNFSTVLAAVGRRPEFDLVVVAADTVGVRERAATAGMSDRVTTRTGVDDPALARLYRGATATFLPSFVEGFGLPALESVSVGTPVVYWAGCDAVAEVVGGYGIAVDSATDPLQWAAALDDVSSPVLSLPAPALDRYSWDSVAAKVDGVLERFVA